MSFWIDGSLGCCIRLFCGGLEYIESAFEEFAALEKKLQHNLDLELDRFVKEII